MDELAINADNILVNETLQSSEEVIRKLGGLLYKNQYVKDSYVQAVLDREKNYPTGLQTATLGIAIPHTESVHVIRSAVAIATLLEPVSFKAMDNADVDVAVRVVIMLAISDPKMVISTLTKVISIVEYESTVASIINSKTKTEIQAAVSEHIRMVTEKDNFLPDFTMGH
jgi:galactitol PTS system EIIA component